ncbi:MULTISPECIES: hypothetical protein [unclassified Mesorhizobium]|uniref:hypothetical protein n=1 Tax=unclassified Mesorhizobium TaxID=325217 RepID=UPI00112CB71C|nr:MULTISPECIES: hypothetical protein [unclassified Mesorhizobium]MBZ9800046.1 hypothetical protein [Mesorhizobium sp. ES1-4]TPJ33816.1 hypothetical protein FJ432_30795 [Mesorhizobium sp. B2-6-5]
MHENKELKARDMNFIGRDDFCWPPLAAAPIGHGNALASIGILADAVAMASAASEINTGQRP